MSHILPGISKDFPAINSPINKKSKPALTFEFYVASEEGINLFVDMNSSLLDCRRRFENEVRTCNCFQMNKNSQSFREELQYLGCKFEQRKNSFVSDTKSCNELKCSDDENIDSGQYDDTVVENGSSLLSYPEAKNEHSKILAQEKHKNCLNVSDQIEHEGENSISCCLSSVASDPVDVNSNIRGLIVGDGTESLFDDQSVVLSNKTTMLDIGNSGNNKPFNASSSNEPVGLKAPSISSTNMLARQPSVTESTSPIKLRKQTAMSRTGSGFKRKKHINEYSERILRSTQNRQFFRRNCKR